jgi:HAD superfamily hydrolase (TIGR01484 family)
MTSSQAAGSRPIRNPMPTNQRYLICTDLDRTLLPNGIEPESPGVREVFRRLVSRPEVSVAYVTGRHRELVLAAIEEYKVPLPDYVIGDVGTSIYTITKEDWLSWDHWQQDIGVSWHGLKHDELAALFADMTSLQLQEPEKQNIYKLSFYADPEIDSTILLNEIQYRLDQRKISASLVWSIDETTRTGLLDILPAAATKRHAIEFLMNELGFNLGNTLFAGDSGNDLAVLTSPIHSVLVANATNAVRSQALQMAVEQETQEALYIARGTLPEMNGNYSAGILEGCAHFMPALIPWITQEYSHEQ